MIIRTRGGTGFDPEKITLVTTTRTVHYNNLNVEITPQQVLILTAIAALPGISQAQLADYIYADDPEGGALESKNVISVQMHKLRGQLATLGVSISSQAWAGYTLNEPALHQPLPPPDIAFEYAYKSGCPHHGSEGPAPAALGSSPETEG